MAKTKIQLTRDVSEKDATAGFIVNKVVVRIGDAWIPAEWETLKCQTFETLSAEGIRFMVDCELNGERVFIVTHEVDVAPIKQKYLGCSIIYLNQIIGLLAGLPKRVEGFEVVPDLLIKLGAEVIGHGKDEKAKVEEGQTGLNFEEGAFDHGVDEVSRVVV